MEKSTSDGKDRPGKAWILIGAAALCAGILIFMGMKLVGSGGGGEEQGDPPVPVVETVEVSAEGNRFTLTEEGFLRPVSRIDIIPEVAGKVAQVSEKLMLGGRFEEGETLFVIDQRTFKAERDQAAADLESARAALARAQADYNRQQELADIGATAQSRLEQARADYLSSEARVAQAAAALDAAQKRLADTVLTAPFPARVQQEDVSVGQYVSPGNAVATLYDSSAAEVSVGIAPQDAAAVRRAWQGDDAPGALNVTIRPVAGSATTITLRGRIVEMASSLDPQARTVSVLIRVPDAFLPANDGVVFADDFVEVVLPAVSAEIVFAGPAGVVRKEGFLWAVDEDSTLQKVAITPLRRDRQRIVFSAERDLSGVEVVLTALTEEREGMEVRIAGEDEGQRVASERKAAGRPAQ